MNISTLALLFLLAACNGSGKKAFESLENTPEPVDDSVTVEPVEIQSFIPVTSPVVMTGTSQTTFAVSVNESAGAVTYEFKSGASTVLQTGAAPYLILQGSSLGPGTHSLTVKASNAVSSDEHVFSIRKNTPPAILSSTPALLGSVLNCNVDTLTFSANLGDVDGDAMTKTWELDSAVVGGTTPFTVVSNTAATAQLAYTPDCTRAGPHGLSLKVSDGSETTTVTWSFYVNNPAIENITSYFPASNSLTYLSTDVSKTFNVAGAGVGALTFVWKLDGATVKTESNVATSSYLLPAAGMTIGDHTLEVFLTDSTSTNDPGTPVSRSWAIYKNMKPTFVSSSPSAEKLVNLNNILPITASIEDQQDTFVVTMTKGALACVPNGSGAASSCGLSSMSLPTATGVFSSLFSPGQAFLGENLFELKVTDAHGEFATRSFVVRANYFSDACNNLDPGEICTLAGLPGLGSGLNLVSEANKVRVTPAWMTQDGNGNWFFSDHASNVVWYYNKLATPVTLFGSSVPAYTLKVVAGTGIAGAGGNGVFANTFALNFGSWGGGLAWDTRDSALYIADYTNSRVVRVNSSGRANVVCGLGALNTQGTLAINHECLNPVDIAIDNTNRRLYVTNQARHVIKYIDISNTDYNNWVAYVLAGVGGGNTSVNGTTNLTAFPGTTIAGATRVNQPWGLFLDTADQILYFTEYGSCRIRALGLPGATSRTVAGQTITAGNSVSFTNSGASCASEAVNTDVAPAAYRMNRPMDVLLDKSGATIRGFYATDHNGHRLIYCNNTAGATTLGGQAIAAGMCNNILGNGSATASTIPPSGRTTSINGPLGMFLDGTNLFVADRGYNLLRTLGVGSTNGAVGTYIGGVGRASYSGNSPLDSRLVTFNSPLNLMHRPSNNLLYVSDSSNFIIRSINLGDGRVEDFAGGVGGNENRLNTTATSTLMQGPKAMALFGDFFLYGDVANNCFVRAYNPGAQAELIFSTLVNSNRTSPVAGYYANCGNFIGTTPIATTDLNARLSPVYGLGVDEADEVLYISSQASHCILKVTADGNISPAIGSCGTTAGASPVYGDTYGSTSLRLRSPGEIVMDPQYPGNFFFADFTDHASAHVKYVNLGTSAVVINGTSVGANSVETVYGLTSSPGFIRNIAAFENQVCFTSGNTAAQGNNTVTCYNRDLPDGTVFVRLGVAGAGGIQLATEQEGIVASSATFAAPGGLAFDGDGNLYISEQGSHVIRMVKKWW